MKISKSSILFVLLFMVWIPARILYGWLPNASQVILVIRFIVNVLVLLSCYRESLRLKDKQVILLYIILVAVSTVLRQRFNVNSLFKMFEYVLCIWVAFSFVDQLDQIKWKKYIRSARFVGVFYLIGSLIYNIHFLVTTPELGYQGVYFFLGSRAESVQTEVLLLFIFVAYHEFCGGKRLELYLEMDGALLDAILFKSGQGITMIGLFIIGWMLFCKGKTKIIKFFSTWKMAVAVIALNYIVLSGLYRNIELVVFYITKMLGKSVSLTGRTIIFDTALKLIYQSPIWGYGYNNTIMSDTIGYINSAFVSGHNSILDIALNTGIPSMVAMSVFVIQISSKLFNFVKQKDRMALMAYITIWVYYIGGLVNLAVGSRFFWVAIALAHGYLKLQRNRGNYGKELSKNSKGTSE